MAWDSAKNYIIVKKSDAEKALTGITGHIEGLGKSIELLEIEMSIDGHENMVLFKSNDPSFHLGRGEGHALHKQGISSIERNFDIADEDAKQKVKASYLNEFFPAPAITVSGHVTVRKL